MIAATVRQIFDFLGPMAIQIRESQKVPISDLSANVVIKYLRQRYVMEAGYFTL